MLVGIMSDSHDDMERIDAAVEFFNSKGVAHVLHSGDLISPFTFELLGGIKAEFTAIFGNNDGDHVLLKEKSGDRVNTQPFQVEIAGRKIVMVHEPAAVEALAKSGEYDVVIYGHTHTPEMRKVGHALVINPGKTARLHKGESTVALLDTETLKAEIITGF